MYLGGKVDGPTRCTTTHLTTPYSSHPHTTRTLPQLHSSGSGGGGGSSTTNRVDGLYAVFDGHGGSRAAEFAAQVRLHAWCGLVALCAFVRVSCVFRMDRSFQQSFLFLTATMSCVKPTGAHPPYPPAAGGH